MIILMHCGGMPFNGETIKQQSLGGSETAAYYIAKALAKRGHRVTLFTNSDQEGVWDDVKYVCAGPSTNEFPLGQVFHFYASNAPSDVLMIQRAPGAFAYRFASKLNVAWLHDLAMHRHKPIVAPAMWNVDSIFTVSEFHKKQVCDVWGVNPEIVMPVTNGIDLDLFSTKIESKLEHAWKSIYGKPLPTDQIPLIYSSRPERGLEHHVRAGGIMDRLWEIDKRFHLYVCAYHNPTPQMQGFYDYLYQRISQMPNVTNLGALTKKQLADIIRQCKAQVYPTEFEEVSCITAMEAMAAGLPFISSEHAALPETCKNAGAVLIPLKDGAADEDKFVEILEDFGEFTATESYKLHVEAQRQSAKGYDWNVAAERFEKHFETLFRARAGNKETVLQHLIHESDFYAASQFADLNPEVKSTFNGAFDEMRTCYRFAIERTFTEHYEAYYEYEKNRGVNYGPESLDGNSRFESVAGVLAALPAGSTVLDYGCAHGHYTVNLAKRFPNLQFVGVDIASSNIDKARKWAADEKLDNVRFCLGAVRDGELQASAEGHLAAQPNTLDAIIAAEVLEHVEAPWDLVDTLSEYLKPKGKIITTTPFGPWEAIGYKEHWPWRAHLHHLEREDLYDLFEHHPNFKINVLPSGSDRGGEVLGSYMCVFGKPIKPSGRINYDRKFNHLAPRQTLSVCLIVKDGELTLGKCLDSLKDIADEIIVAVDNTTKDSTREIAGKYVKGFSPKGELLFDIPSPMEIGFDEARNLCIAKAKGDWVLWIDSDEVLFRGENLRKYLRENQFSAYGMRHVHYSVDPVGIIRIDLPTRLFRNGKGVKFFGMVHEHPEFELNKGIGHAMLISDVDIAHYGYATEEIRRGRFNRNIGLLVKDREKYPNRHLGKFLWVRDLAQMCKWEAESNGGQITDLMRARAQEGLKLWEELLASDQTRMLIDSDNMQFYSILVQVLGGGFDFTFRMDTSKLNGGAQVDRGAVISGRFAKKEHAQALFLKMFGERTADYDSKYF